MKTHKDLDVWHKSIDFAENIYHLTREFPRREIYGLISQLRRSAVSISANLAEGAGRQTKNELLQFLYYARGSSSEIDTLLEICKRTEMTEPTAIQKAQEQNRIIARMISAMIRKLKTDTIHQ